MSETYTFTILNITETPNLLEDNSINNINNNNIEYEESCDLDSEIFLPNNLHLLASSTNIIASFSVGTSKEFKLAKFSTITDPTNNFTIKNNLGNTYLYYSGADSIYTIELSPIIWNSKTTYAIYVDGMNISGNQNKPNILIKFSLRKTQFITLFIKSMIGISGTLTLQPSN